MTVLPRSGAWIRLFELDEGAEFEALLNASAFEISSELDFVHSEIGASADLRMDKVELTI